MRQWKLRSIFTLAMALGAVGCHKTTASSGIGISISAATGSVVTNLTDTITPFVTGTTNTGVNWTVGCQSGVTAGTCGTITATTTGTTPAVFTAPATVPTVTSSGTTTAAPSVTITGTAQADTTKAASTTITIISGISVSISPATATVGAGTTPDHFPFTATVINPGCNTTSTPTCLNVTWSVPAGPSTNPNEFGTIAPSSANPNIGIYQAPTTLPSPATVTVTAKSVADTTVTATASVSLVTSQPPTVTSVLTNTAPLGGLFQDVYITGTNFISTNNVYINNAQLNPTNVTLDSSSLIRARIPDSLLAAPPASGILQFSVAQQSVTSNFPTCTNASLCQVTVKTVRPVVTGTAPVAIQQGPGGGFFVDGGFFGISSNPAVTATYNGQLHAIQLPASGATRQLTLAIGGSSNPNDTATPGLYPVNIRSATDSARIAATNIAVQPNYGSNLSSVSLVKQLGAADGIGTSPSDVAINPRTGMAVVVNTGSNTVNLIDLTASTPAVIATICTAGVGTGSSCPPTPTSPGPVPTSVAVDYVRNIALVVNSGTKNIAVVDLATKAVTSVTMPPLQDTPMAIGVNPLTGRSLIAMQSKTYGILMDSTQTPPLFDGEVSINTGSNPQIAVEPQLNWAVATPGGSGSIAIVDLDKQNLGKNDIASVSRSSNAVTVTISSASSEPILAVQTNRTVQIQGVSDATFNGFYTVTSVLSNTQFTYQQTGSPLPDVSNLTTPGTVNYSVPVFTNSITPTVQGVAIDEETQQAVFVDPSTGGFVTFFSLVDQSSATLALKTSGGPNPSVDRVGPIAAAYDPLTNTAVAVSFFNSVLSVIDPTQPGQLFADSSNTLGLNGPVAVAVDPGENIAVVANQTGNSVTIVRLGVAQPLSITEMYPRTVLEPQAGLPPTLTVIGEGFGCSGNPQIRLDGAPQATNCVGSVGRELTATVQPSSLTTAHRFAVDVVDSSGHVSNAEDFTVELSIDLSSSSCSTPQPSGVAVDPQQNVALVTLFGCSAVDLIDMPTGTITNNLKVGSNPIGVAVIPRLSLAVIANNGSNNATIVDDSSGGIKSTVAAGSGPMGAAADSDSGEFAIANNTTNTVTVVSATGSGSHAVTTGLQPIAVAFNYTNQQLGTAAAASNAFEVSLASASTQTVSFPVNVPTSVAYDPVGSDCKQTATSTTTPAGCFLVNSSTNNLIYIIDPLTAAQTAFRVGINPTSIAYNYLTGTLVTTNTGSHTMTVADLPANRTVAVLPLPTSPANSQLAISGAVQFALDIHPFTNVAAVADTANGKLLFIPLPH